MKLFHLSDLHIGKRLNEYPLNDDQRYVLNEVLDLMDKEAPDALLIAGDVYDKTMPPADAVTIFDDFLWELARRKVPTFIIAGNHDSAERLSFGSRIMEDSRIYISRTYDGMVEPKTLDDEWGEVNFYLLPFVRPAHVRHALAELGFEEEAGTIRDYTDALRAAIAHMNVDTRQRNVLLSHQFVTGAKPSDSEEVNVGGIDNVDASVFDPFDYVALGHIHGPQKVGRETVRYCGTPLKYSFSEKDHEKSVTVVEVGEKGDVSLRFLPLRPLHDMREIRGTYDELMLRENYVGTATDDYLRVILTDEYDVPNAVERLRNVYHNVMELRYDNLRTRSEAQLEREAEVESVRPKDLFASFFERQNNQPMDERQRALVEAAIETIWEGEL